MSIVYCEHCERQIDTDYDVEHFNRIPVTFIKSEYPLGTTDGQTYTIIPRR